MRGWIFEELLNQKKKTNGVAVPTVKKSHFHVDLTKTEIFTKILIQESSKNCIIITLFSERIKTQIIKYNLYQTYFSEF